MIQFDQDDMTNIELLNEEEAKAFALFLYSELKRHEKDIILIRERVKFLADKFGWEDVYK